MVPSFHFLHHNLILFRNGLFRSVCHSISSMRNTLLTSLPSITTPSIPSPLSYPHPPFSLVSGGPFGIEDIVRAGGPFYALLGFSLLLVWAVPEALVTAELSTAMPEARYIPPNPYPTALSAPVLPYT